MSHVTQFRRGEQRNGSRLAAFTIVELLVVLVVLALGAMLLVPALARTQPDSGAARCLNNHRQLARAWLMYASDNNDRLATGVAGASPNGPWLLNSGWLDWSISTDNTNTIFLTNPRYAKLAQHYGKDARLFKCPADQNASSAQRNRGWKERVRSVSWNVLLGDHSSAPMLDPAHNFVKKMTDLLNPKPAETWVVIDEHPDSINDGALYAPSRTQWIDLPANSHDGGAGIAFADGHSEIHRWQSSALRLPVTFQHFSGLLTVTNDPDLMWLRYHTPRKPGAN